ncbi:MAG TPA: hypothetical protein VK488_02445 [Gaiellaceae bacterium]|nr:hypothetical protein [Gaiellaceae bacterium]
MTESVENEIVADVARGLVAQTAPQELPLFRAMSEAYFKDPQKVLEQKQGKDEMLGFGVEIAMFVAPVALEVAKTVVTFLVAELRKSAEKEASGAIQERVHELFHRDTGGGEPQPGLTREQLARVHEVALKKASELKLPKPQADLLADSVVGSLSVA